MKAKKKQSDKVFPEDGVHVALLTQILDWGTVTDVNGDRRKVELVWELPESLHVFDEARGEEPLIVASKYGNTLGRGSYLMGVITGMMGQVTLDEDGSYELENLLGKVCQLNLAVETNAAGYENVKILGITPLPKGDKRKFKSNGDLKVLDLDNFDEEVFKSLPDWKQKEIAKSPEYKEVTGNSSPVPDQSGRSVGPKAAPATKAPAKKASDLFSKKKK